MFEMPKSAALMLQGGSLRCLFTAGVLDVMMEREITFPCVGGVSAGSLCGINYVARQPGRTAQVNLDYVNDKRYMGLESFVKNKSVFNFDFLFGELSQELLPLDYDTFYNSPQRYVAFSTDCRTGELVAHEKGVSEDILMAARASCSIPLMSPMVEVDGRHCLDGGVASAVPVDWAIEQGYDKIVVVLTRQKGYRKKPVGRTMLRLYQQKYRDWPLLVEALRLLPVRYNELHAQINRLERSGRIFVIRPRGPVQVSRVEKDVGKLKALYEEGRHMAEERLPAMLEYLNK